MSACGIMLVKDERDVIEANIRHLAGQLDALIVADNGSSDGTEMILADLAAELPGFLEVREDKQVAYYQSRKMTALADQARIAGHSWVVPVDADEWWYSPHGTISEVLARYAEQSECMVASAVLYDHRATGIDPPGHPFTSIGWRASEPGRFPKVAARLLPGLVIEQGNHGAHYPGNVLIAQDALIIRHFPYRSVEQFVQKVVNGGRAYEAAKLPESIGQHWREYYRHWQRGGDEAIAEIFHTWFWQADPREPHADQLVHDPIRVQEGVTP